MMRGGVWQSVWRWSAVTRVAAAAPSGLRPIGLRPFAVFGLAGAVLMCGVLQAAQEPVQQKERVTDGTLRSLNAPPAKAVDVAPSGIKERLVKHEVTGEVVATTSRTLSLETSRTGGHIEEMLLPVDPAVVKLDRIVSLADLGRGDRVRVEYRQRFREAADGEFRLVWTEATKISLLSRAMSGPPSLRSTSDGGGS